MAQKWHQESPSQRYASLNGEDSNFLRNTHSAKKHSKKGLNKMQASKAKVMCAHAKAFKALVKPKEVKPKIPRAATTGSIDWPVSLAYKLGKCTCAHITKGLRLRRPESNVKA
ncbi:60S ribosomal protein L29-like [Mustela erminea]|uniref:60S ribosomal protein L29-like n=1 Tax=Mustela erminea TaxID=36723 RepID=UPI001386BA4B|nr:60S ribosomal protein L29-like [Mustela erminea]